MAQRKKFQVFISSTYSDLLEERQAAVEAVLTAGHIPAGMELFAAGNESQMNVIKRWIDESDIYMLILGGRYGSIEPKTGKSYIHLEYEYALRRDKPLFAVVIDELCLDGKVKKYGTKVIEREHPDKLKKFRTKVLTKLVRFWQDSKDIKLAVFETISEFNKRMDLAGWIPGDEVGNTSTVIKEFSDIIGPTLNKVMQIMEKQDEINRHLFGQIKSHNQVLLDLSNGEKLISRKIDKQKKGRSDNSTTNSKVT